jgi:hypothetical protein
MKAPKDSPNGSRKSRWDAAILALLQGATREKAAKAAHINAATLYRWQKDPDFQKAQQEARREAFGQAMGHLRQGVNTAVETLIGIMKDVTAPVGGRVQACKCVLELSRKSVEEDDCDWELRLVELERAAKQEKSLQGAWSPLTGAGR